MQIYQIVVGKEVLLNKSCFFMLISAASQLFSDGGKSAFFASSHMIGFFKILFFFQVFLFLNWEVGFLLDREEDCFFLDRDRSVHKQQ